MSAWKRVALEKLPEYRKLVDAADSPMALWIELHLKFEDAHRLPVPDADLVRRFYEYARWCWQSPGSGDLRSDAGTAVACAFYEHLPQNKAICRDLPRWLTNAEFAELREVFRYHLSEPEFSNFESEFISAHARGGRR